MAQRVLFVDDDPNVLQGICRSMHGQSFEVLTAASAGEALILLAQNEIAVVVSDERMPEMGGSQFLGLVREQYPEAVRLLLTGQASVESTIEAINCAKVHRFLLKPCAPEDLAFTVEQALEARDRQRHYENWKSDAASQREGHQACLERGLSTLWMTYQPLFRANDQQVFGYEALVRTDDPSIGHPGILFELAAQLDRVWEVERMIRSAVARRAQEAPGVTFLVNVHPLSLNDESLFAGKESLVQIADRVILEITERASLGEINKVEDKVQQLRKLGYRIAVDDLGAGYSGLTSFALLSPEIVKFDMSLIRDIHCTRTKSKLVTSMASLCRELNILTVAEGIETEEEREHVVDLGCDLLQGFLLARPAPELIESQPLSMS
jgi:EAL domain-containing protein (putative c-di-GMP-specific phosphodiesterase class I)